MENIQARSSLCEYLSTANPERRYRLALLESGKNVITPLPYHYLKGRGDEVEARFKAAARKGGATLFGSGITPGFFNERLAMTLTGLTNDVEHIRFQEFFNVESLASAIQTLQLL